MLIDTHCHLTHGKLAARVAELLPAARDAGVAAVVSAATDVADAKAACGLARRNASVFFSVGVHPHEAADAADGALDPLADIAAAGGAKCVAVGEIGLDYHYDYSPRPVQRRLFEAQLDLAERLGKPVIIHSREATSDTLAALQPFAGRLAGVMHSYSGDAEGVRQFLAQGWCIGFSGIVTFKKAGDVRAAAVLVPPDRLLVETDAPFLSPEPVRKIYPNRPDHVVHTARFLAELRGVPFETLAAETTANAKRLFALDIT